MGVPQIIHVSRSFHYNPFILGTMIYGNPHATILNCECPRNRSFLTTHLELPHFAPWVCHQNIWHRSPGTPGHHHHGAGGEEVDGTNQIHSL